MAETQRHRAAPLSNTSPTMPATRKQPAYRVRDSSIHGRGVFATRTIRKGTTIIEYRGDRTTWAIASRRPDSDPANPQHTFLFELSDGNVIDAGLRGNAARWINHSCNPNCDTYEDERLRVFIEARRTIRAGEELTYDYQLSVDGKLGRKAREAYACRCGARGCRGTMLTRRAR
jgi:SET domain-containing protein